METTQSIGSCSPLGTAPAEPQDAANKPVERAALASGRALAPDRLVPEEANPQARWQPGRPSPLSRLGPVTPFIWGWPTCDHSCTAHAAPQAGHEQGQAYELASVRVDTAAADGNGGGCASLAVRPMGGLDVNLLRYLWSVNHDRGGGRGLERRLAAWLDKARTHRHGQRSWLPAEQLVSAEQLARSAATDLVWPALQDAALALEALAWCHAFSLAAARISPRLQGSLAEELWSWAAHGCGLAKHAQAGNTRGPYELLLWQLWSVELPLAVQHLVPGVEERVHVALAVEALRCGLEQCVEPVGERLLSWLQVLPALVACWTRCALVADAAQIEIGTYVRARYALAVLRLLQLARSSGQTVFCTQCFANPREWFRAAAVLAGGETLEAWRAWWSEEERTGKSRSRSGARSAAAAGANGAAGCTAANGTPVETPAAQRGSCNPGGQGALAAETQVVTAAVPEPWYCRGEPCLAVLRPHARTDAATFAVLCEGENVLVELESAGRLWLHGPWQIQVWLEREPLPAPRGWQQTVWEVTDEALYLELESTLGGELLVQRSIVFSRREGFLLLADALLGTDPANIRCELRFSLPAGVAWHPSAETREGMLAAGPSRLRLLPLGLPEWRCDPRPGSLEVTQARLVLQQQASQARRMLVPLWIDLAPRRWRRACTWRQLTVGEDLAVVPPDVACAYRVQVGREQWLAYRTLGPAASRTMLGHHLVTELLVARFNRRGLVEPIIELE